METYLVLLRINVVNFTRLKLKSSTFTLPPFHFPSLPCPSFPFSLLLTTLKDLLDIFADSLESSSSPPSHPTSLLSFYFLSFFSFKKLALGFKGIPECQDWCPVTVPGNSERLALQCCLFPIFSIIT